MFNSLSSLYRDVGSLAKRLLGSTVTHNALSLYVIQVANYILPLVRVPYLARVLGPSTYGTIAFAQGFLAYFQILVDYGFNLSATQKISIQRENKRAVSKTAVDVWAAKAVLCFLGLILLLLLASIVPKLQEVTALLLILYFTVIGNVAFPTWLFQGMEKMVFISAIKLAMSLFVTAGVFVVVRSPEDYLLYAWLISIGSMVVGCTGAVIGFYAFNLHLYSPSWQGLSEELADGWEIFILTSSVSLYTAGNAFILGLLTDPAIVGYYSSGEKIVQTLKRFLTGPISQAVYPRFSKMAHKSKDVALKWGRRMLVLMGGSGLIMSLMLFAFAPWFVKFVLGPDYTPSISVIRVLAALPFLVGISNVLGVQIMLPFGRKREFMLMTLGAGTVDIVFALILVPILPQVGMAIAVLLSEAFMTFAVAVYLVSSPDLSLLWGT